MAGVCAFLQAEKPVLGQDQKVFLALEAGFKQLDQPAQDTGGTLLPGPWLVSGGGVSVGNRQELHEKAVRPVECD